MSIQNKLTKELPNGGRVEYYSKQELLCKHESVYGIVNYRDHYNKNDKLIYRVTNNGWWVKFTYDDRNRMVYYENSNGVYRKVYFIYRKDGCIKEEMEIL